MTSHEICAISATKYAQTFFAIRENSSKGNSLEYAVAQTQISFGLFSTANLSTSSKSIYQFSSNQYKTGEKNFAVAETLNQCVICHQSVNLSPIVLSQTSQTAFNTAKLAGLHEYGCTFTCTTPGKASFALSIANNSTLSTTSFHQ